jgi:hypothetical protein
MQVLSIQSKPKCCKKINPLHALALEKSEEKFKNAKIKNDDLPLKG